MLLAISCPIVTKNKIMKGESVAFGDVLQLKIGTIVMGKWVDLTLNQINYVF